MSEEKQNLDGRVAIITGATRGIGKACALALAKKGCNIVLASRTVDPHPKLEGTLSSVAAEVEALGVKALQVPTNVRKSEDIENMVKQTVDTFGRVDIMINNAGAAWWFGIEDTPVNKYNLVNEVNSRATFLASREVIPHMKKNGWGHIINMSPPIKPEMAEGKIAYMISKFGMTLVTIGLAKEMETEPIGVHSLWPVTLIESAATLHLGLGQPEDWRKADILADATVALVSRDPKLPSGKAWFDEEVLKEEGITDFTKYACVEGKTPMTIPW
jgi:citronellol/citronellal dehydrogenase